MKLLCDPLPCMRVAGTAGGHRKVALKPFYYGVKDEMKRVRASASNFSGTSSAFAM